MPTPKQRFVALDREVLLGWTLSIRPFMEAFAFFEKIKFFQMVTPTTMAVVKDMERNGNDIQRHQATLIIQAVLDSNIVRPPINETYRQVMDIHAEKLLETNVLRGGDKADALILVEASYLDAHVLLTTNKAIKSAQKDSLKVALLECGLESIVILSPQEIVDYLARTKKPET